MMRRSGFALPFGAFGVAMIAAALAVASARADGLPVLGIDVGSSGVATADGARYVTMASGARTVVARVAEAGGRLLVWRSLPGTFTIPAVAYDGSAGGLSADGRTLALIEPRQSFPRARTRVRILGRGLVVRRPVTLRGDFSFDAISNGAWLSLIHYTSPQDPTRYLVQRYDVRNGRLSAAPIVDPAQPGEKMRGNPLTRVTSADGRWAYTLYDGGGATPFVHALDTVAGSAHCIDLDALSAKTDLSKVRLAVAGGGHRLEIRGIPHEALNVDLRTFRVTGAHGRALGPLSIAVAVLLAATIVFALVRRRRRYVRPGTLEPQGGN